MTIPASSKVVGNSGHTTDHNLITAELRLKAPAFPVIGMTASSSSAGVKTANTALIAAALATAAGSRVVIPAGTFYVDPITLSGPVEFEGVGRTTTILRNDTGSVFVVDGSKVNVKDLTAQSDAGGHTVRQSAAFALSIWKNVELIQLADGYSVWDNGTYELTENHFLHGYSSHTQTATVPSWNLVANGGQINNNNWEHWRANKSGNYHWWVEASNANAQYQPAWRNIVFEVCTGGLIRLISVRNYLIDSFASWDMNSGGGGVTTLQRHGIYATANASSISCVGNIKHGQRLAGALAVGVKDIVLPNGGLGAGTQIESCRTVSGVDPYLIDLVSNYSIVTQQPTAFCTLSNTAGATVLGAGSVTIGDVALDSAGNLAAWTSYTPTVGGTGWALGNGTTAAKYTQVGKIVYFRALVEFGTTSTFGSASPTISVPVTAAATQSGAHVRATGDDAGTNFYELAGRLTSGEVTVSSLTTAGAYLTLDSTHPFTWTNGDRIYVAGTYEAA